MDTFWRMVWEYNSAVIVTLCSVEQDKQVCSCIVVQFCHVIFVVGFLTVLANWRD